MKIYTLEYLKKESAEIAACWNGGDEKFMDQDGNIRPSEDAEAALELSKKIEEVENLITELEI